MKELIIILLMISFIPAYAEETGIQSAVDAVFDWMNDYFGAGIENLQVENDTKTNLGETLETGIEAGKEGTALWFGIHDFVVSAIHTSLTEAGFDVDRGMISVIANLITFGMIGLILFELFKRATWIFIIVVILLVALGVAGIVLKF